MLPGRRTRRDDAPALLLLLSRVHRAPWRQPVVGLHHVLLPVRRERRCADRTRLGKQRAHPTCHPSALTMLRPSTFTHMTTLRSNCAGPAASREAVDEQAACG